MSSDHSFAFNKLHDRVTQLEMKVQLITTELLKLRNEVRVVLGQPRGTTIELNSESYTVGHIEPNEVQRGLK